MGLVGKHILRPTGPPGALGEGTALEQSYPTGRPGVRPVAGGYLAGNAPAALSRPATRVSRAAWGEAFYHPQPGRATRVRPGARCTPRRLGAKALPATAARRGQPAGSL